MVKGTILLLIFLCKYIGEWFLQDETG